MRVVDRFLRQHTKGEHVLAEYEERKSLLWNSRSQKYVRFRGCVFTDDPLFQNAWGYLSITGNFIFSHKVMEDNMIIYVSLAEYLKAAALGRKAEVKYVSILC